MNRTTHNVGTRKGIIRFALAIMLLGLTTIGAVATTAQAAAVCAHSGVITQNSYTNTVYSQNIDVYCYQELSYIRYTCQTCKGSWEQRESICSCPHNLVTIPKTVNGEAQLETLCINFGCNCRCVIPDGVEIMVLDQEDKE